MTRAGVGMLLAALAACAPAGAVEPGGAASRAGALAASPLDSWSTPELIAAQDLGSGQPAPVALDSGGDAFAVFDEPVPSLEPGGASYLVRAAVRPSGGRWQAPATLSQLGLDPEVTVDGQGDALAVWQGLSSVQVAERPARGNWLPVEAVLTPGGGEPQIAANALGDAIVAAPRRGAGRSTGIEVALRSAGGAFSTPRLVSGPENAFEPRVAMNALGDVLVAWRVDSENGCPVRAAFHRAGSGPSRPRTISDRHAFCEGASHRVAIDERGEAIVVWFAQRGRSALVEDATLAADGRWGDRRLLAKARTVERPEVGMDARGDALVAWWAQDHEWARARRSGGRWSSAQLVASPRGAPASLAMDPRGDALLAWSGPGRITAASRLSGARGWQTSVVVSERRTALAEPTAAIGPSGAGVVAWFGDQGLDTAWRASLAPGTNTPRAGDAPSSALSRP